MRKLKRGGYHRSTGRSIHHARTWEISCYPFPEKEEEEKEAKLISYIHAKWTSCDPFCASHKLNISTRIISLGIDSSSRNRRREMNKSKSPKPKGGFLKRAAKPSARYEELHLIISSPCVSVELMRAGNVSRSLLQC
jgi:hypothetical protein